jgi:hypothetical protein
MSTEHDISNVVGKIQKLLQLASKNPNEHEASQAAAKAQELLTAYNLDMAVIEKSSGGSAKREEQKLDGGMYQYQRDLWEAVARLNFCMYWTHKERIWKSHTRKGVKREYWGVRHQHRVVGRTINVTSTKNMVSYLEQTIERLCRERLGGENNSQYFSGYAVSYRTGIAERVIEKIGDRRREMLQEEERKRMDAEKAAREAGAAGVSTSTAVTISSVVQSERDGNIDFLYGEGTSARWAADRAAQAAANKAAEEAYTTWAAANPEEAARKEAEEAAERRKAARRGPGSRGGSGGRKGGPSDAGAYYEGRKAGESVGLDPQVDRAHKVKRIA